MKSFLFFIILGLSNCLFAQTSFTLNPVVISDCAVPTAITYTPPFSYGGRLCLSPIIETVGIQPDKDEIDLYGKWPKAGIIIDGCCFGCPRPVYIPSLLLMGLPGTPAEQEYMIECETDTHRFPLRIHEKEGLKNTYDLPDYHSLSPILFHPWQI